MDAGSVPTVPVSATDVATYRRDGVICLRGVFDEQWREVARRGIERNLKDHGYRAHYYAGGEGRPSFFQDAVSWWRIPEYLAYCLNSPAAAIAGMLMGARKVNLFFDNIMLKDPGSNAPTPWHHDVPYWPVEGDDVCSIWMPLDPITKENRLEFVKGSHRWGKCFLPNDFTGKGRQTGEWPAHFEPIPDFDARREEFEFLSFDMQPGDCVAFHGYVVHGAPGNMTDRPRRAMITRFTGDDARYAPDKHKQLGPPFPQCALKPGDRMTSESFPVVWQAPSP